LICFLILLPYPSTCLAAKLLTGSVWITILTLTGLSMLSGRLANYTTITRLPQSCQHGVSTPANRQPTAARYFTNTLGV
jgi:Ca2+/H+ antiporter